MCNNAKNFTKKNPLLEIREAKKNGRIRIYKYEWNFYGEEEYTNFFK